MNKLYALPRVICLAVVLLIGSAFTSFAQKSAKATLPQLKVGEYTLDQILVRDPCIVADKKSKTYYLYCATSQAEDRPNGRHGVKMYKSKDLAKWTGPYLVYEVPENSWASPTYGIWAPEVHAYKGKYYLFATQTNDKKLLGDSGTYPPLNLRGTQIFVSDSPEGPFTEFANKPHTPMNWLALDGTLWVENGTPYMIFCHEWVQVADGTMEYVELKKDLSDVVGESKTMFTATDAEWVRSIHEQDPRGGYVTDGCYLYRTKTDKLLMIWSSFCDTGYAVSTAFSDNGKLDGNWTQSKDLIFSENGGHGMLFTTFDGKLMISLHYPNSGATPHTRLFELEDTGDNLILKK